MSVGLNNVRLDDDWVDGVSNVSGDGISGEDFMFHFDIGPNVSPSGLSVLEPSAMLLLWSGVVGMAGRWRKRWRPLGRISAFD